MEKKQDLVRNEVEAKVEQFIEQHELFPSDMPIFVGFSGGADSTALLLLLERYWSHLTAVHLNHQLRGRDSDEDEAWCAAFCRKNKISFKTVKLDVTGGRGPGESVEMVGRRLRLDYWKQQGDCLVALGHHRDDALETTLIRFCRGCNSSGLYGLRPRVEVRGVQLVRPLLCLTRAEIERYLRVRGVLDFRYDKSNADASFLRNRVRHELIPLMQELAGGARALHKTADFLRADAELLERLAERVELEDLTTVKLRRLDQAVLPRVLRRWLRNAAGREVPIGEVAVDRVREALDRKQPHTVRVDLNGTYFIRVGPAGLQLEEKNSPKLQRLLYWNWKEQQTLRIPNLNISLRIDKTGGETTDREDGESFDASMLTPTLVIRPRQPGDCMVPFGSKNPKKLKKLISDRKLTPEQRRAIFLVCLCSGEILWTPGVRRSELGRVTEATKCVVRISIQRHPDVAE